MFLVNFINSYFNLSYFRHTCDVYSLTLIKGPPVDYSTAAVKRQWSQRNGEATYQTNCFLMNMLVEFRLSFDEKFVKAHDGYFSNGIYVI